MNQNSEDFSDEQIARLVQGGDLEKFGVLVERYEGKMKRYASRFLFRYTDKEDLVQEVFLKVFENIQGFDAGRSFSAWLYRIAHNEFINAIKKREKNPLPFFDADTLFPHPVAKERADDSINDNHLRESLDKILGELDTKYREPVILHYFEGMSYKEIGEILKLPVATVGVRIMRGKDIAKKLLERLGYGL